MKKSCDNCAHCFYEGGFEYESDDGYICTKKDISDRKIEMIMLIKMNDPVYRAKGKKCFSKKEQPNERQSE